MSILLALTTTKNTDDASTLARALVTAKLVACVNIVPTIRSVYHWHGALQENAESLLLMKTLSENREALKEAIQRLHTYECPELLFFDSCDTLPEFLRWVTDATQN